MSRASPWIADLARSVISLEARRAAPSAPRANPAERAWDGMRAPLANLMGVAGFVSLSSRALAMARADEPSLAAIGVRADGSLEGFEEFDRDRDAGAARLAGEILVARLVELLATFIGESLTVRLLNDIWPDASAGGTIPGDGEHP